MPVDLRGVARVLKRRLPLPIEGLLRVEEQVLEGDLVDPGRSVLVVDDRGRAAADDLEAVTPGLEAVVAVLEVAEVVLVERPDPLVDLALDVGAREDDPFDLRVGVELVNVLLAGPDLLPPEGLDWHVRA